MLPSENNSKIKVLVIGYVWPEPDSSAAGSHILSIMRQFILQGWKVEFATPAKASEHMVDLSIENISSKSIILNCDSFDEYLSVYKPDIVMFDRFMMEEQFGWRVDKTCPDALKILDTEDLQCLRHARHQALKAKRELQLNDLFNDIAKREIAAILRCDISLIISSYEIKLLKNTFNVNSSLLHHLPFMIEIPTSPPKDLSFSERRNFMMIGNFRHAPNWDAVLYLQEIWPLIRNKIPDAQCHIYGSYPTPKALALNNPKTGFLVKGWVKNSREALQQARVCLAPLRFGAGLKGKLIDAMQMQTPSITTNIGSEGMHNNEEWPGAIENDSVKFAAAAVHLYTNKQAWLAAQKKCQGLLEANFDSSFLGPELISKIIKTKEQIQQHRLNNFTGAMLKHHTMMSTKYMSQWIAEKNK